MPYRGHLENGVPFPTQFPGYHVRDVSRSYTTPEVAGALLDAIEAVRTEYPDTCDVFIGDFTTENGGSASHHRSHQNGRDVDVGLYAKDNRVLDTFMPMNEENLDPAKTWCLIENIIRSQRVQYIFLDRRIQKIIYDYAATRGYDQAYLDRVFGNVRGSLIQHIPNHYDHMHVRFFTPWSTLAAHIGGDEVEKRAVVEMAQQSYLPKKVNYYVNGTEKGLDDLAKSFGVSKRDLCAWNHLSPSNVLVPGSCLVFYKRSFESEGVQLASSLQPGFIAEAPRVRMASVRNESEPVSLSDGGSALEPEPTVREKKAERAANPSVAVRTYTARKGDTLDKIARRNKLDVKLLCQLNGIKKTSSLKPGQTIKTGTKMVADSGQVATDATRKGSSTAICFTSDSKKPGSPTAAYYTVNKGGILHDIAKKTGIPLSSLCQLNGLSRNAKLKPGQAIKLTQANLPLKPALGSAACAPAGKTTAAKDSKKITRSDNAKASSRKASGSSAQAKSTAPEKVKSVKGKQSAKPAAAASAKKPGREKDADKAKKSVPATAKKKSTDAKSASAKSADRTRLAKR